MNTKCKDESYVLMKKFCKTYYKYERTDRPSGMTNLEKMTKVYIINNFIELYKKNVDKSVFEALILNAPFFIVDVKYGKKIVSDDLGFSVCYSDMDDIISEDNNFNLNNYLDILCKNEHFMDFINSKGSNEKSFKRMIKEECFKYINNRG